MGQLVARHLVAARARPVLAGRSHQNLAALGVQLGQGLDIAIADSRYPETLRAVFHRGDVVVSTAGPFTTIGSAAIDAAVDAGATYIDCATEAPFLRRVFTEVHARAREAGVTVIPAMGFQQVAGSLAAELALGYPHGTANRVEIGYFVTGGARGGVSHGLRSAHAAAILLPQHAWRDGRLAIVPAAHRFRRFNVRPSPGSRHATAIGLAVGGCEPLTLPRRHPQLRDVQVYAGSRTSQRTARLAAALVVRAGRVPALRRGVAWTAAVPRRLPGPTDEQRSRMRAVTVASAYGSDGRHARTVGARGPDAYTLTALLLAWAALFLASGDDAGAGAVGPVDAFGLGALRDACDSAGLEFTVTPVS